MRREELPIDHLAAYARSDMYPFHMPGYKRRTEPRDFSVNSCVDSFISPFVMNVTEIKEFGDLHHPEGILRDSMKWAVDIYGTDQTYYMINGSTDGILTVVCGSIPRGGRILVSRDCHKSVYHGICLNQLRTSYVCPREIGGLGIWGGIMAEDMDRMLNWYMDTRAVLIVCLAYDGIVSNIEVIAWIVHRAGPPLVVNGTHGTYFRYSAMSPVSALNLGVDVMVQSIHKALPNLAQAALLHIKCNRSDGGYCTDRERIDRYIHMMQSSNPSYMLVVSTENNIYQMEQTGMTPYGKQLHRLHRRLDQVGHLRLADTGLMEQVGIGDLDIFKIAVPAKRTCLYPTENGSTGLAGTQLDNTLHRGYHLEMGMCGADYVTAITTVMDSRGGLERLGDALTRTDSQLTGIDYRPDRRSGNQKSAYSMQYDTAISMGETMKENMASVGLEDSVGYIPGEFVYIHSPGIPIMTPGERISRPILEVILGYRDKGLPVQGPAGQSLRTIRVVQKD